MNKIATFALIVTTIALGLPLPVRAAQTRVQGTVNGKALDRRGEPLGVCALRLRNIGSGRVEQETGTDQAGQFTFQSVPVGDYLVEVVDSNGKIIATSSPVTITADSPATSGVMLVSPEEVRQGCVTAAVYIPPQPHGNFFTSTAGIVVIAAASAGIIAVAASATGKASPSR